MRPVKPIKPSVALARLQDRCSRSELCSHEVLTTLHKWGLPETVSMKILGLLKRDRFVDDARFARAFVRDKVVFNRWGKSKVRMALAAKHLDREIIDEAIEDIDDEEYSRALCEVLQSKARSLEDLTSFESRNKLLRYAASRGFEISMVISYIKTPEKWMSGD